MKRISAGMLVVALLGLFGCCRQPLFGNPYSQTYAPQQQVYAQPVMQPQMVQPQMMQPQMMYPQQQVCQPCPQVCQPCY